MTFWVAGAAVVGAIGGALISSNGAQDAADTQAQATRDGIGENRRQFDINQSNQAPYLEAGKTALGQFQTENNSPFDASKVQMEPGYQFGLNEGLQAQDRKIAASGGRLSGAALKAAAQYGNDYGTTKFDGAYNRQYQARSDRLNRLAALANIGQTSTQQVGALGANMANNNANMITSQGNATGAAQMAQGNIWAGATNQLAALYSRSQEPSYDYQHPATAAANNGQIYGPTQG